MQITFAPRGILQIDDARLIFRNFRGLADKFNREGDRNFAIVIPTQEQADALMNDTNEYGVGWNVKVKAPREEGDEPFRYLKVKVSMNDRGPIVYLNSGGNRRRLTEETIGILDNIDISHVDLDVRPYDDTGNYGPFRSAYLQAMEVTQNIDRFSARYAEEEYPCE
jgi:hypothetical protein